ncbi:MAG TPA: hypothetical protein VLX58_05935 [Bryobacteraceae bacterium]|nr:hypothetical protein [Bryobacteraceae bacterium]
MRKFALPVFAAALLTHAATTPLTILKPGISDIEGGPSVPPTFTFVPGQFLFLSFEIAGYKVSPEQKIHLSYKVDALDPKGVPLLETIVSVVDATLADEDKNWHPRVHQQILLPPLAPSGTYGIAIQVKDDLSGAAASQQLQIEVRGHEVAPSDTLVVRNLHFYRGEEDREPLAVAAYKPGDTVWARFDITGYKFGPGNAVNLDYGISVAAPSGKVLFTQEKAAEERSSSFYPKFYVPGSMSLNVFKDTRPGQFTVVVTTRDHIGNQTAEAKSTFTVE